MALAHGFRGQPADLSRGSNFPSFRAPMPDNLSLT
jgi:hypothetical protein